MNAVDEKVGSTTVKTMPSLFIFGSYLDPSSIIYGRGSRPAQRRYTQSKNQF
jgi:hypothetical protein